ncbi:Muscle M-line assembly protein unc-89 [Sugiyamaella lignohabitans]|uniref:Muscle M-line assembly protein unc-89 n=1 Tax=Sugiyamaella lignohabitans TaxID=796027 RepID=A0A161HLA2_9ASCO|nr:Muscle M-line assembly protein unc-89 [Sugiyamaella lignohabitans]ANB14037.1 Muscle M-line assembly protein unc-89 [Sugiyamaella lignohabitans]
MDGLFKLLWPMSHHAGPSIDIPTYQQGCGEDQIDLQIKSLLYMFRRCGIAKSEQFRQGDELNGVTIRRHKLSDKRSVADLRVLGETPDNALNKYSPDGLQGMSAMDKQKLDVMYSKSQFERVLSNDEHRVLIDWTKNKFRSLCILSGRPKEIEIPSFECPNYHFIILPADASEEEYIRKLSTSDLYIEHSFSLAQRQKIIKEILFSVRAKKGRTTASPDNASQGNNTRFSKDERAFIIHKYLSVLATEIQVERLYRATLRAKQQQQHQQYQEQLQQQMNQSDLSEGSTSPPTASVFGSPGRMPRAGFVPSSADRSRSRSPERLSNGSSGNTGNRSPSRSPERLSNGTASANRIYIHGQNPASHSAVHSPKPAPKLSSYPSLPSLSSTNTRPYTGQSLSRSPSPGKFSLASSPPRATGGPVSMNAPTSPSAQRLRSKASNLNLRKTAPDLAPSAVAKIGDNIPPAIQRETMEQARFAVRSRIEKEKSLLST